MSTPEQTILLLLGLKNQPAVENEFIQFFEGSPQLGVSKQHASEALARLVAEGKLRVRYEMTDAGRAELFRDPPPPPAANTQTKK